MSQIRDGNVDVTNGSTTVTGNNTTWVDDGVSAGDLFVVSGDVISYEVASVTNNTELELTGAYQGDTADSVNYSIHTSFTPNKKYPFPETGDFETATVVKKAIKQIDDDNYLDRNNDTGRENNKVSLNSDFQINSISDLQSINTTPVSEDFIVYLKGRASVGDGGEGHFRWDSSDLSTEVGNDSNKAIYVPPDGGDGSNGAWVKQSGSIDKDVTVAIPSTYATLQEAVDAVTKFTMVGNSRIALNIESGTTITSGLHVEVRDCAHIWITGDDSETLVDLPAGENLFSANHGAYFPIINQIFDMQGTGQHGIYARRGGTMVYCFEGKGVKNAGDTGAYAYRSAYVDIGRKHTGGEACIFSGGGKYNIRARRGGYLAANGIDITNAVGVAAQANYGGYIAMNGAHVGGAGGNHIECLGGSIISATPLDLGGDDLKTNIRPSIPQREGWIISSDSFLKGDWSPEITGAVVAGNNTYVTQQGRYFLQNGMLHVWGRVKIDGAIDSEGALEITNLPFPIDFTAIQYSWGVTADNISLASGKQPAIRVTGDSIDLRKQSNTGLENMLDSDVDNDFDVNFYGAYEIAIPDADGTITQ